MQHHAIHTAHFHGLPTAYGMLADLRDDPNPTLISGLGGETPLSLAAGMSHYVFLRKGSFILTRALLGGTQTTRVQAGGHMVCSEAALLFPLKGASGVVLTRVGCRRRFEMGGPLMLGEGDYRYVDGGSTSLLKRR